jgi:hypothetical protein
MAYGEKLCILGFLLIYTSFLSKFALWKVVTSFKLSILSIPQNQSPTTFRANIVLYISICFRQAISNALKARCPYAAELIHATSVHFRSCSLKNYLLF